MIAEEQLLHLHHTDMPGETVSNALELRAVRCARKSVRVGPVDAIAPRGHLTVLRGGHASGKELLLRLLGLLEMADEGDVLVRGSSFSELSDSARAELRRHHFGYLFAAPFLLPAFTVIENVVMPMFKLLDSEPAEARQRAEELLAFVGVSQYEQERAGDLPHFKQRCVALARALATNPEVLIVEELDSDLQVDQHRHFSRLLRTACQQWGTTVIASVSPQWLAAVGDHVYEVSRGQLELAPTPLPQS